MYKVKSLHKVISTFLIICISLSILARITSYAVFSFDEANLSSNTQTKNLSLYLEGTPDRRMRDEFPVSNATDGNRNTFAVPYSNVNGASWIEVNLQRDSVIEYIELYSWGPFVYTIELSTDGVKFDEGAKVTEQIETKNEENVYYTTLTFTEPKIARYVRISMDDPREGNHWTALSFDIYGYDCPNVEEIIISGNKILSVGETTKLSVDVLPANANGTVYWESDNESVASVDSAGVVLGMSVGTANITATSKTNPQVKATHEVKVIPPEGGPVQLSVHEAELVLGKTLQLSAKVYVEAGTDETIIWSSKDESVVSVSDDGLVEGVGIGRTTITATSKANPEFFDTAVITVKEDRELENLSFQKPVQANKQNARYPVTNLVDGDYNTFWSNGEDGSTNPATIVLDLEELCFIDQIIFTQPWDKDFKYLVEISSDGKSYDTFFDHTKNAGTHPENIIAPNVGAYGQYLRFTLSDIEKGNWFAISEIVVIGYTVAYHEDDKSVFVSPETLTLLPGGDTARFEIFGISSKDNIKWKSFDRRVANVQNETVTSVGVGKTTVSAIVGRKILSVNVNVVANDKMITNDTFYVDTDGNPILSEGGGIFKFDNIYYWYGVKYQQAEEYSNNPVISQASRSNNTTFSAVTCYSSTDLINWKYEGDVVTKETFQTEDHPNALISWFGRMGVMYNEKNNNYTLVSQGIIYCDETEKEVLTDALVFLSCSTPTGNFGNAVFQKSGEGGLKDIANGSTGDQTVFIDDDGTPYLICSSTKGRNNIYVCKFDENYMWLESAKWVYYGAGREGNCMFKYNGIYYIACSDLYGWNSSPAYILMSDTDDILGTYTMLPSPMEGSVESYSHVSQTGFFVTIHGSQQDTVIFCGDRWSGFAGNGLGFHSWEPLSFKEDGTPIFNDLSQFYLDIKTGVWEVGPFNNYVTNPAFEADRIGVSDPRGWETYGIGNCNEINSSPYSGRWSWAQRSDNKYSAKLSQKISNLPVGKYTLKAWVKSSGGQKEANLYMIVNGSEVFIPVNEVISEWTQITIIENIKIENGECEIGLYSNADSNQWVLLDDVTLIKTGE